MGPSAARLQPPGSARHWLLLTGALCASSCARYRYELLEGHIDPIANADSAGFAGTLGLDSLGGAAGFTPDGGAAAGGAGNGGAGGAAGNAGSPLGDCAVLGDFGEPELVQGLGAGPFFSPALFDGELQLVFASPPPADLFSARRASRESASFDAATALGVNTSSAEVTPWMSEDGLTLLFASDRPGAQSPRDLLQATRSSVAAAFGTPAFLSEANSFWTENLPSLHDGGRQLLFTTCFAPASSFAATGIPK